ncbi:hypothetical protein DNTS_015245 [Danionella cerebrum]|uniref:Uncharacterized protein n=1 Tax=Danionella cerebrum TaxID=2873325 RepID=A0A553MSF0_9TELE|nr:hypothetical protein DNTS_015245 [Danionella translucida]TRY56114.1 hypothetical protein DNTS_015245 [Danionella translucida]
MHVTILKKGKLPEISRCTRCCNLYHCPFCERYKTSAKFSLDYHIGNHLKMALQHAGQGYSFPRPSSSCEAYSTSDYLHTDTNTSIKADLSVPSPDIHCEIGTSIYPNDQSHKSYFDTREIPNSHQSSKCFPSFSLRNCYFRPSPTKANPKGTRSKEEQSPLLSLRLGLKQKEPPSSPETESLFYPGNHHTEAPFTFSVH